MLASPQANLSVLVSLHLLCPPSFISVLPFLPSTPRCFPSSFSPPHPRLPCRLPHGHVTLLPSRKSLSTICLAGCDEFGALAEQINSVKLMTLSARINFARVSASERVSKRACPPEMLHNPQRHLTYPVADGRCAGGGRGGITTDDAGCTHELPFNHSRSEPQTMSAPVLRAAICLKLRGGNHLLTK